MPRLRKCAFAIAALTLLAASVSHARPFTPSMTCGEAANTVSVNGAIVMDTGPHTYDRFVVSRAYCTPHERTKAAFAYTLNNPACQVGYTCEHLEGRSKH